MNVLSRMIEAVKPLGLILDLQVIRPNPKVELNGRVVAEIDGEPLFRWADAATAAIDARIEAGDLMEEATDDHEVSKHYTDGAELVEDVAGSKRRFPEDVVRRVAAIGEHVVTRELCRLRRLRVRGHASDAATGAAPAIHDTAEATRASDGVARANALGRECGASCGEEDARARQASS